LGHDALKRFAPIFLHAERHGVRQKFLKHLRRLDHAIEVVRFDVVEEVFEPKNAFQGPCALLRVRGHEPAEGADHDRAGNPGDDERERRHTQAGSDRSPNPDRKNSNNHGDTDV